LIVSLFVLVLNGTVVQTASATFSVNAALQWVDVSAVSPSPQPGWAAVETAGVWTFTAPAAPPAPTLAQQAAAAINAGVTLQLTGSLTLTATFPCDSTTASKIGLIVSGLLASGNGVVANGKFPGGATTFPMKDTTGVWHTMTPAQYATTAEAIESYAAPLLEIIDGNPAITALPSATIDVTMP
jgi:hypothetical protein